MENKKERESRQDKLDAIIKSGINPYPSKTNRNTSIQKAKKSKDDNLIVAGKIVSVRSHGKSTFIDLQDESDLIQVYFKLDTIGEEKYTFLKNVEVGDYIEARGGVFKTKTGELTIAAKDYAILSKSLLPVPDKWYGLKDTEIRYRKRYLDLIMNPDVKKNIETRSKIIGTLRSFMQENGFLEVETPILQAIPGGASAKPFITKYNILKQDMYLRIAPELFLKRLIVGGFEKVFEIGRQFRNEGVSHMHNPEFTSIEFYWAYQDYEGLMKFTEELTSNLVVEVKGSLKVIYQKEELNFAPPYPRITFDALIEKDCGINIYKYPTFDKLKGEVQKKKIDIDLKNIKVWPKLVDELYKKVSRPKIIQPTFVIDHPLVLVPLAKAKEDEPQKSQTFQLVCGGGFEILKAYSEQNDPKVQEEKFKEQVKLSKAGWDESNMMDNEYVEALKYGMPPTAGWGMGIERIAMILTDQHSIKEIIAFPTLKNNSSTSIKTKKK
ncbi:MAG: lysine--tRNA ligase [bacterium]